MILEEIDPVEKDDSKEILPPPLTEAATDNLSDNSSQEKMIIKYEQFSDDDLNLPPLVQISAAKLDKGAISGTASPVKAAIVKALASKLTKRKNDPEGGSGGEEDANGKKGGLTKKPRETIRTHKCDECGKLYAKKDGLQKHKLTHENRSYFCPFCSHTPVKSNDSLRRHFRVNHTDIQEQWNVKGFINSCIVKNENNVVESSKKDENWMNEMLIIENVIKNDEQQIAAASPLRATNNVPYINNNNSTSNNNNNNNFNSNKNHLQTACDVKCAKINLPNNNLAINMDNNITTTNIIRQQHQYISTNSNSSSSSVQNHHHFNNNNNHQMLQSSHNNAQNHELILENNNTNTSTSSLILDGNSFTDNHFINDDDNNIDDDHHLHDQDHHHLILGGDIVDGMVIDDEFEDAKFLNVFINATVHD